MFPLVGKHLYTLNTDDTINALTFSPNRYWLCAATGPTIKIWVRFALFVQNATGSCVLLSTGPGDQERC